MANESDANAYFDDLTLTHRQLIAQENNYYPFGMELVGTGFAESEVKRHKYGYNGKEEIAAFGLSWQDYGARDYDSQLGRWFAVDPLAELYQSTSSYHYALNNPIRYTDIMGMGAGDFVDQNMNYLGSDGKDDGRVYVVTDKKERKNIKKTDKAGGVTNTKDVSSKVELPSEYVRGEMKASIERSNSANTDRTDAFVGDDDEGGFHEEGAEFGIDENGEERVVHAAPGDKGDPMTDQHINMNINEPANPSERGVLVKKNGSYHVHPGGFRSESTDNGLGGGTKTDATFDPNPSEFDLNEASSYSGNSYVLAPGSKSVTVYNKSGTVVKLKNLGKDLKKFTDYKTKGK